MSASPSASALKQRSSTGKQSTASKQEQQAIPACKHSQQRNRQKAQRTQQTQYSKPHVFVHFGAYTFIYIYIYNCIYIYIYICMLHIYMYCSSCYHIYICIHVLLLHIVLLGQTLSGEKLAISASQVLGFDIARLTLQVTAGTRIRINAMIQNLT